MNSRVFFYLATMSTMPKTFARKSAPTIKQCVGRNRASCHSHCKWASGGKRSFCRTAINYKKLDDDIFIPMKKKKNYFCCPTRTEEEKERAVRGPPPSTRATTPDRLERSKSMQKYPPSRFPLQKEKFRSKSSSSSPFFEQMRARLRVFVRISCFAAKSKFFIPTTRKTEKEDALRRE